MRFLRALLSVLLVFIAAPAPAVTAKSISFTAEVWADNWFALYVNGKKVGEDSVPITTQKSFNSEVINFSATYPLTIGLIAKDYVQSASGLEYLGTSNQQIGDGGLIFQIRESASNKLVATSDESWRAKVSNTAPTNPDCEKSTQPDIDCKYLNTTIPSTWASTTFKDTSWKFAKVYTASEVGPKDGYSLIVWQPSAKFIWGENLKLDNIVYFRKKVTSATNILISKNLVVTFPNIQSNLLNQDNTCDGKAISPAISWSGVPTFAKSLVLIMDTIPGPPRAGETQVKNHFYIVQSNIPVTSKGFAEGAIADYFPPCSQGPGMKQYRVFLFALNRILPPDQKLDGASLYSLADKEALSKASVILSYERKK